MMVTLIAERQDTSTPDVEQAVPRTIQVARPLPRPLTTIAVAFAGEAAGAAALMLAPAKALAARLDADLVLIQVQPTDADPQSDLLSRTVTLARRNGLCTQGRSVSTPEATPEAMAHALLAAVRETSAGLLVMASREAYGSVDCDDSTNGPGRLAEAVVRLSPLPVLLVPPGYGARSGDGALRWIGWESKTLAATRAGVTVAPLRLVVALDGSPVATVALLRVGAWAQALGAEVSLVRVAPRGAVLPGDHRRAQSASSSLSGVDAALGYLTGASLRLQADGVAAEAIRTAVRIGPVADQLLAQAAREDASILVLAHRPGSAPTSALRDSVTAQILRRAALPVLLVPAT